MGDASEQAYAKWNPVAFPAALLLLVAFFQIYLARTAWLTPWKGGGFGMFSTTDGNANRYLRVFVSAPERSEELLLRGRLDELASRAQAFPSEFLLKKLAEEIVQEQKSRSLPVQSIQIQVWRIQYAREYLEAKSQMLRNYTYHAGSE